MTRITLLPAIVAVIAIAATPALAKTKKHHHHQQGYTQSYVDPGPAGWNTRNVSDPSLGNRGAINAARSTGRCVADLGYGRYEYCGW